MPHDASRLRASLSTEGYRDEDQWTRHRTRIGYAIVTRPPSGAGRWERILLSDNASDRQAWGLFRPEHVHRIQRGGASCREVTRRCHGDDHEQRHEPQSEWIR